MTTRAPSRLGEKAAALVVAQRLDVDARGGRHLAAAQPGRLDGGRGHDAAPRAASARATSSASTSVYAAGTSMSNATTPGSMVETPKVKNEQQELSASASRCVRLATAA